ncbi:MAG: hypothetical protein WC205_09065 [Opitutaceae bacterium]|jgi:hypothetical protein
MKTLHSRRSLFFIILLSFCTLVIQAEPATPKPVVMFTAFAWDALTPDGNLVLNITVKNKLNPVQIAWRDRSAPFVYEGSGPLVFTRTEQRDGRPVEVPVASADIPAGVSRALLVFGRNPGHGPDQLRYLVKVLDDSYTVFPGQSVRFLNYSQTELGGSLGGQDFSVAPGGDKVVPATLPETNRLLPFKLARRATTGSWKRLRSTGLPMTEGLRVLVFMTDDRQHPDQPELVLLRDRVDRKGSVAEASAAGTEQRR